MIVASLASDVDFAGWRAWSRSLLARGVAPSEVLWRTGDEADLFAEPPEPPPADAGALRVPKAFVELAQLAVCHSDADRFDLLYRLLSRLAAEPRLMQRATDPDVIRLDALVKSVRRDRHKMTAFVRFRETPGDAGAPVYVAWFEPDHYIEELVAPFFVDRYAQMDFAILTPRKSILWRERALSFGPGAKSSDVPGEDGFSKGWDAYYRSTFNPARLAPKAMLREMPARYWANMPETRQIPAMMAAAAPRVTRLLAADPAAPTRRKPLARPEPEAPATPLAALRAEAAGCQRCDLCRPATQTVFGEGPETARALFVGEQPGDQEDLAGRPFVGPAGAVFAEALAASGLPRSEVYVTNAVKHFKFEPRGKKRIHKTPNAGEIDICKFWLDRELATVTAPLVIAMGGTALQALTGRRAPVSGLRGRAEPFGELRLFVTVHPSYLLRIPDPGRQRDERARFFEDFREIARLAAG